jgi:hypothetical protein
VSYGENASVTEIVIQFHSPSAVPHLGAVAGRLESLHPDTTDPALATWYRAVVPDNVDAEAIAAELRGHAEVEAAYVKPAGAAP